MDQAEFCRQLGIDSETLSIWIEQRWIVPNGSEESVEFTETDVARANLILELYNQFEINVDGVDVLLALLDQVHGLRAKLDILLKAIHGLDEQTRFKIASDLLAATVDPGYHEGEGVG